MEQNKIDFLAIGDITVDAFIRIKEASVTCDVDHHNCKLSMNFADKIPYEFVEIIPAVGNSANAAVAAARLGLSTALVCPIGLDHNGDECISHLATEGISTKWVEKQLGKKTNYHYVLWYEDERTILVKHEAYTYKWPQNLPEVRWIYLSSMGEHTGLDYYNDIAAYLKQHPKTKLVFQPGTFQMKLGVEKLSEIYKLTEIFVCNVEESQRILKTEETDLKVLLKEMHNLGPKIVCITDGPKGAYASDGNEAWFMPPYPDPKPPYERTGAGDSFTSTFAAALALGKSFHDALLWAPINPMSVVQYVGAQHGLLTKEMLETHLKNAPQGYQPKKL